MSDQEGVILDKMKRLSGYALNFLNTYTWFIFGLVFIVILKFYNTLWKKKANNIIKIDNELTIFNPRISGITEEEYKMKIPIRDYFVMSSYNSCAGGDTWQDWVDINILEKLIKMGIRGFDFELYMKDGKCVVAVGPEAEKGKFVLKGSFNYIEFSEVMKKLDSFGFGTVQNSTDPIFINLRIKSNNPIIYDKIAATILDSEVISKKHRLDVMNKAIEFTVYQNLYKKYKYKNARVKNIINEPLSLIKGKMVFICNDVPTNSFYAEWNDNYNGLGSNKFKFMACINISNVIGNCLPLDNFRVVYSHNKKELKTDSERILTITTPDITTTGKNPKWEKHAEVGCQLIYMNFSNRDGELISYIRNWDLAKSALIKKPDHMRFFPISLKVPKKQKEELKYGERKCNPDVAFMQCI